MSCPSIEELVAGGGADHARGCDDCRAVVELIATRVPSGCGLAEALLAAQATGTLAADGARLLVLHLERCAACRLVAGSLEAPAVAEAVAEVTKLERTW